MPEGEPRYLTATHVADCHASFASRDELILNFIGMKRIVTMGFVFAGLLVASSAMALNLQKTQLLSLTVRPLSSNAVLSCSNWVEWNAYYQDTDQRLGNKFNFAPGSQLTTVNFWHYGFGLPGPYAYNLEVWDPTSCTKVGARNGLSAADAANASAEEVIDMCSSQIILTGNMIVAIDPNTCIIGGNPNGGDDCYPDLEFDNQFNNACPYIIRNASTAPVCTNAMSATAGAFLLGVSTNGCATPARHNSWGSLKSIYR